MGIKEIKYVPSKKTATATFFFTSINDENFELQNRKTNPRARDTPTKRKTTPTAGTKTSERRYTILNVLPSTKYV